MTELGRRAFFARLLSGGATLADTNVPSLSSLTFPKRQLGRTGEWVPILGFGTSGLGKGVGDDVAAQLLNRAVDLGVNYIDTGPATAGYERAQLQIGRALGKRRAEIFLASKVSESGADAARVALEQTLRELRTDHVDLLVAHSIGHDRMNPALMFSDDGVFEALRRAKEAGLARYVGVSGFNRADRVVRAVADYDLDVMMTTANFADVHTYGFEAKVWPLAHRKGLGIAAMKVYGGVNGGGHTPALLDAEHHSLALRYALSLEGCTTAVIGMVNGTELDDNVRRARAFTPLTEGELAELLATGAELARAWGPHLGSV